MNHGGYGALLFLSTLHTIVIGSMYLTGSEVPTSGLLAWLVCVVGTLVAQEVRKQAGD